MVWTTLTLVGKPLAPVWNPLAAIDEVPIRLQWDAEFANSNRDRAGHPVLPIRSLGNAPEFRFNPPAMRPSVFPFWKALLSALCLTSALVGHAATLHTLGKVNYTTTAITPAPGHSGAYYLADSSSGKLACGEIRLLENKRSRSVFTFNGYNGKSPSALITIGKTVYGITSAGGKNDNGVLFRLRGKGIQILAQFDDTTGTAKSLAAVGHTLYGACDKGAFILRGHALEFLPLLLTDSAALLNGTLYAKQLYLGNLYQLSPAGSSLVTSDWASTTLRGKGRLFGIDIYTGLYSNGRVMSYDPATNTVTTVVNFQSYNGGQPSASAVLGDGTLLIGNSEGIWKVGARPKKVCAGSYVRTLGSSGHKLYGLSGSYPSSAFEVDLQN